jgi:hypothetical protein
MSRPGDADDDVRVNLAVRDGVGELRDERRELRVDVELVRVRVLALSPCARGSC